MEKRKPAAKAGEFSRTPQCRIPDRNKCPCEKLKEKFRELLPLLPPFNGVTKPCVELAENTVGRASETDSHREGT